jgi:hypothetical protein
MTTTPRTWVVGETVTAAIVNTEIRDQFNSFFGTWTAWTPTWTAVTTNPVLGNGTFTARYLKIGRTCQVNMELNTGSTTTYGSGAWIFSLPFTAASSVGLRAGVAHAVGTIRAAGHALVASTTTFQCYFPASSTVSNLNNCGAANPFTWAAANILRTSLIFEADS